MGGEGQSRRVCVCVCVCVCEEFTSMCVMMHRPGTLGTAQGQA